MDFGERGVEFLIWTIFDVDQAEVIVLAVFGSPVGRFVRVLKPMRADDIGQRCEKLEAIPEGGRPIMLCCNRGEDISCIFVAAAVFAARPRSIRSLRIGLSDNSWSRSK